MKRRDVLASVGAVVGTGVLAGCFGSSPASPEDDDTTTTTPPTTQQPEPTIIETVSVGDEADVAFPQNTSTYVVMAVNRSEETRDLDVTITRDGSTAREFSTTLDPLEANEIQLVEPADYTVDLRVKDGPDTAIEVNDDDIGCNQTQTTADITADDIETQTVSTTMACAGPGIERSTIEATDKGCASGDTGSATVTADGGTVRIQGTIWTPTPCYKVGLRTVELTEDGLRVVVEHTPEDTDTACMECVGAIEYAASVTMNNAYPDRVIVEHADDEDTTVVTETDL